MTKILESGFIYSGPTNTPKFGKSFHLDIIGLYQHTNGIKYKGLPCPSKTLLRDDQCRRVRPETGVTTGEAPHSVVVRRSRAVEGPHQTFRRLDTSVWAEVAGRAVLQTM